MRPQNGSPGHTSRPAMSPRNSCSGRGPPTVPGGSPLFNDHGVPTERRPSVTGLQSHAAAVANVGTYFSPPRMNQLPSSVDYRQPAAYRDYRSPEQSLATLRKDNEERRQRQLKRAETTRKILDEEAENESERNRQAEQERWHALMARREQTRQAFTLKREESMKLTATYQPGASAGAERWQREVGGLPQMLSSSSVVLTEAPSTERTADEGLESSSPSPRRLKNVKPKSPPVDPKVCEHAASLVP